MFENTKPLRKQKTITLVGTLLIATMAGLALFASPVMDDSDKAKKKPPTKSQPAPTKKAPADKKKNADTKKQG